MVYQKLPGIKYLGYVQGKYLQRQMMQKSLVGIPVGIMTDTKEIAFAGQPTCEATSDYDNGGRIEKTTLKFVTGERIDLSQDTAFVVTDVENRSYVIGTREKPHPIVRVSRFSGETQGAPAAFSYEVTLYAHRSLIHCSI